MNKYHKEIFDEIIHASKDHGQSSLPAGYNGNSHPHYNITIPKTRSIAKDFLKSHSDLSADNFVNLLTSLYQGRSENEKIIASILLGYANKLRRQIDPYLLDQWLEHLEGWAEIDSLCQNNFSAKEMLEKWETWEVLIKQWNLSDNIAKRRVSLVILVGPTGRFADEKLANLAFANINQLKSEKDILITKAISWLLRCLIANHRDRVVAYLADNKNTLPKIALRETLRKLETGKK